MSLFKKSKKLDARAIQEKNSNASNDGWMREDFILVSNRTKAKDLKPYQRLVVLRKPDGEQKCIIDKSLPFSEIERIQELISSKGFVDINSDEFTRIIPNDYKSSSEVFEESHEAIQESALTIKKADSSEFSDYVFDQSNACKSIIKLEDENFKVNLKTNKSLKSSKVNDVDLIDDVEIYIPYEDRKLRWDTIDDTYSTDNVINTEQAEEVQVLNENEEIAQENLIINENDAQVLEEAQNYQDEAEYKYIEETTTTTEETEVYDDNTNAEYYDNQPELVMESENDYNNQLMTENISEEIPRETVTSFYKNEIEYDSSIYNINQRSGNYYKFYDDSNKSPVRTKVVNKKVKMIIRRKKIDKSLIEANALKRQGLR